MEKELELVHKMNRELGGIAENIKELMEHASEDRLTREENREVIIKINENVKDLNSKVAIQNGRVLKSETKIEELINTTAEMARLLSRHNGELLRREKTEEARSLFRRTLSEGVTTKVVYIIVGILTLLLVQFILPNLELTHIIDLIR